MIAIFNIREIYTVYYERSVSYMDKLKILSFALTGVSVVVSAAATLVSNKREEALLAEKVAKALEEQKR